MFFYAVTFLAAASASGNAPKPLEIVARYELPVAETSGLAWGLNPDGRESLIAVGDTSPLLYFFTIKDGQGPRPAGQIDVSKLLGQTGTP
ncbi:MAG TPA: hypothetical protein VFV50_06520, partial [Bdellovibrionales bacterium]|nr:hypothetical protein [Bdellovibrionales bacterium]